MTDDNVNPGAYGQPYRQHPPVVPGSPAPGNGGPYAPLPALKKRNRTKAVVGVSGGLVALCVVGVIVAALNGNSGSRSAAGSGSTAVSSGGAQVAQDAVSTQETEAAQAPAPEASDFKLTPKITQKQCFGSAGCLVDYEVNLEYGGPTLDTGDESGPITDQIEVTGNQYTGNKESVATARSSTKIKIKVTDVEKE
jgi:hypothetical protein